MNKDEHKDQWIVDLQTKLNAILKDTEYSFNQWHTDQSSFEIALKPRYLTIIENQFKKIRELGFIVSGIHLWTGDLMVTFTREGKQ